MCSFPLSANIILMRIGHGYDVHKLVSKEEYLQIYPSRKEPKLILAGVVFDHDKVLLGHSDADLVIHALCDALLGASAQRDIGFHFPDSSEEFAGLNSFVLLNNVQKLLEKKSFSIVNIDITLIAQEPKVAKKVPEMIEKIAQALNLKLDQVNLKATTTEKLGFIGRGEGMACEAVCLLA